MSSRYRTDAEHEPERSGLARSREIRPAPAPSSTADPILALQATAGNAAVTALLHRTGGAVPVQRLRDDDEEQVAQGGDPEETNEPAEGGEVIEAPETDPGSDPGSGPGSSDAGTADGGALEAVRSQVEADLDPPTVIDALAPIAATAEGPGDFVVPGDGTTAQALFMQRDGPDGPEPGPPRAGGPGDVIKALMPFLQPALDKLLANVLDAITRLKTGEKIAATIVIAPILIAPLTQPGPRRLALDQLDGTDVTFGVIPNLQLKPSITDGQLRGGTLTYDLAPALRKLGLPF